MKKDIEQYLTELDNQINYYEERKNSSMQRNNYLQVAANGEAWFQLKIVKMRLEKILQKDMQKLPIEYY